MDVGGHISFLLYSGDSSVAVPGFAAVGGSRSIDAGVADSFGAGNRRRGTTIASHVLSDIGAGE